MSDRSIAFAVGKRRFPTLSEAVAVAGDPTRVYRLHLTRRGIRNIERRTPGGNWHRVQSVPVGSPS